MDAQTSSKTKQSEILENKGKGVQQHREETIKSDWGNMVKECVCKCSWSRAFKFKNKFFHQCSRQREQLKKNRDDLLVSPCLFLQSHWLNVRNTLSNKGPFFRKCLIHCGRVLLTNTVEIPKQCHLV